MSGAGTELDRLYFTIDGDLGPLKNKLLSVEGAVNKTGAALTGHMKSGAKAAREMGDGIEVSRRELLYMAREVATGDLARLPSTLVLIGSHMAGITSEAIIMGGAIAGPFVLMATAAFQAEKAAERVRVAIAKTGNAAGVTTSQVGDITNRLGAGGMSSRGANDVLASLIGSGNVSGRNLEGGAGAANALSKMTGQGLDKSADAIGKMMADPAKAAKDLHEEFKLLTDAQMVHILSLKSTDAQQAELFAALKKRGDAAEESLWSLSKAFDKVGQGLSNFWFNTGNNVAQAFGAQQTPQQRMDRLNARRGVVTGLPGNNILELNSIDRERGNLHWQMRQEADRASKARDQKAADDAAADAHSGGAMRLLGLRDRISVAGAGPRDEAMRRARLQAQRQFEEDQRSPEAGVAPRAGAIRSASIAAAQAEQNRTRKESLTLTSQAADAEELLAGATRNSAAAASLQESTNKAHAEFLAGSIDDENAYAAALMRSADAQREIAAARKDAGMADEVGELTLRNSLSRADETLRDKELADLKARNELVREGYDLSTSAGQAELQRRLGVTDAMQAQLKLQRDLNEEQKNELSIADDLTGALQGVMDNVMGGKMKNVLPGLLKSATSEITKLGIMNPLKNAITGKVTGTEGKLPTFKDFGALLAGPRGSENNPMWVRVVGGGGSTGGGSGGGGLDAIHSLIDSRVTKALPGFLSGAVDAVSQAVGRGFGLGGNVI